MTARGIKVNHDGSTLAYAKWTGASFMAFASDSIVVSGWVRIKGVSSGSNADGHSLFIIPKDTTGQDNGPCFYAHAPTSTSASPWTYRGTITDNSTWNEPNLGSQATNEDWYIAMAYDGTGHNAIWYYGIDQAGSLTNTTTGSGLAFGGNTAGGILLGGCPGGVNRGANIELTNVKVWLGGTCYADFTASSGAWLYDEMNSESVVHTSNLHSHWKLASSSDLTDYSGNSHTLVLTGAVTDGSMDPVDLQTSSGSACTFYGRLLA